MSMRSAQIARALPEPMTELSASVAVSRQGWPWSDGISAPCASNQQWPRISVVTPSFNQGEYLEAAMRSVLAQAYPNLEYIVLDGGSTDQSVSVIKHYAACLEYWCSARDAGQSDAIARGFDRSSGDVLCWLNSDDMLLPGALWHVAKLFKQRAGTRFVYGNRLLIDAAGMVTARHIWPRYLTRYHWALGQPMAQECCFWSRELYEQVGGLDRSRFFTMDHDLFYRMSRVAKFHKSSAVLGCLRVHEKTKNTKHKDVWQRELAQTCAEFDLHEPGPLLARFLGYLDRCTIKCEHRALPPLRTGVSVGEMYTS